MIGCLTLAAFQHYDARMAIQFLCPSCKQPIEVDSMWGGKTVACPYCRGTVTAPDFSTLPDAHEIPMAAPVATMTSRMAESPSSNLLATVAFGLTLLMVALLTASAYIVVGHSLEMEELTKQIQKKGPDPSAQFSAWVEYTQANNGTLPGWLLMVGFMNVAGMAICMASLICGLIALRNPVRRGWALASVLASGSIVALLFVSVLFAFV